MFVFFIYFILLVKFAFYKVIDITNITPKYILCSKTISKALLSFAICPICLWVTSVKSFAKNKQASILGGSYNFCL